MPNKVDYRTFSQRVKNKYPEYINMGDLELAQMWVNENPQYGEFVMFDQQPVKKKDQAAPSLGAQGGLPSQQPSAQPKRAKEERFFGGTFGNLLDALDMPTPGVPGSGLGIGDFIDDMGRAFFSGKKAGVNMSASRPLFFSGPGSSDEEVQNFVKAGTEYIGPSDEATQFYKDYEDSGKTTFGFVKALAKNPGIAPELVVQSASQLLFNPEARATLGTAIAAGAGIGALAGGVGAAPGAIAAIVPGVAAANTAVSTLSSFSELMKQELDQRGLEFNEDNVRTILEDEKALRKIRAKSAGYGITIGAFDLATAKVGGAIAAKIPMTTRAGKIRSTLAITGAEAVGGSAGEAAARGVTGQELDPAEIGLEGIAEIPGAAPTMLSQVLKKPTYKINGEFVGQADVDDILQNSSRQELENTKFEVFNDVNMYGSKFRNRLEDLGLLEEITEANPNASEADINRLFELNSKLKKVEKLNSESAKASTDWLRSQIREVQDGLLTQEFAPQEARQAEEAAPEAPQMAPAEVSPEVGMEIPQEDQGVLQVINSVVQPISSDIEARMNNAEEIPMSEIEAVVDALIDAQQSVRSQEGARTKQTQGGFVTEFGALSEDQKRNFDTLIEQQINKLLNYEFATITTTEQAGEKTKTAGLVATPREGRPLPESVVSRDRFDGAGVRIGGRGAGRITVKRLPGFGGRSVYGVSFGNRKGVTPVENLEFDNLEFVAPEILADGSFNARIKDSQSGLEFTITDPELSIDLAIAAQLKEAGRKEFPQPAFLEAVREATQGQPTQVTTFPNLGRTGTTPAAVGVEPQTEQDVRQETNAPQEGRGQGEDAAPVPQEEGRQEGQVTPLDVAQEGETPPATKRVRKTEQQKADEGKAALDKLKETIRTLRAKPGGGANIDLTFGVVPISKAVWNTALDTAILAIDAGQSIAQVIKDASDYISSKIDGDWGKAKFEQYMDDLLTEAKGMIRERVSYTPFPDGLALVDGWYSNIEKKVREAKQDKQSASAWLNSGLIGKGDEATYTGVRGWLELKKPNEAVAKKEVLDWMKDNRVEIVEVTKGEDAKGDSLLREAYLSRIDELNTNAYELEQQGKYAEAEEIQREIDRLIAENYELNGPVQYSQYQPRYSKYQLEGKKENYKEVVVTLPSEAGNLNEIAQSLYQKRYTELNPSERVAVKREARKSGQVVDESGIFKSSHFDEPNILVHLRMNTRTDADGNKVLFLEEIQSDWGQRGKKEGFKGENKRVKELAEILKKDPTNTEAYNEFQSLQGSLSKEQVPTAPFVTDTNAWTKLAVKVAMREAAKQGVDKIAWTTGEQQNERYDLSKQVDYITKNVDKINEDRSYVDISTTNGLITLITDNRVEPGKILEVRNQGTRDMVGKNIEDVVGKDVATRIIDGKDGLRLEGEGLKIGGKGMKGFYDKIVPDAFKSVVKELTGQDINVVDTEIQQTKFVSKRPTLEEIVKARDLAIEDGNSEASVYLSNQIDRLERGDSTIETLFNPYRVGERIFDPADLVGKYLAQASERIKSTQQSVFLTPRLKRQIERGMPLFEGEKASVQQRAEKVRGEITKAAESIIPTQQQAQPEAQVEATAKALDEAEKDIKKRNTIIDNKPEEIYALSIGVDPKSLSYLGKGDFGKAYGTQDGRVIKITSSANEAEIAKELIGKRGNHVEIYDVKKVDNGFIIFQQELDTDSEIEDNFQSVEAILSEQGLPIQYLGNLDYDELSQESKDEYDRLSDFISDLESINRVYRALGIEASDLRPENLGYDKDGKLKAFDIQDRSSKTKSKDVDVESLKGKNESIAEAYHKAKADGSNPKLVQAVEDLLGQAAPEAKPAKTIAEQRKEFRETAKKYFDGLKKMGIAFDPEGNSKEDIAFLKALAKYIKLELDAGMVTFKGFIEKTANLVEDFKEASVVKAAKDVWAKEVVKAYPKLYAKYSAAKRKELEKEIKDIRKTMIRRIMDMTEPKIVNFKSQLKTEKRRLSKEAAAQLAAIRNAYDAKTMMAMEPEDLMELMRLTEGIYKEGRSEIKALNESLDEAAQIQGEEMLAAIASKDKRLEKMDSKEAASKMLAKKAGVVVAVKGDDRVIMKEEKDLEALDGEGYTFLFLNTTSDKFVDRGFLDSVVSFFSGKLRTINENARDFRTALELIKSRSKESQDFINGLVAKMNKASVTKSRKSEEWSSILKRLRSDLFGPDIKFGYTNWMNAIAKVDGKPLKLINGKGVSIGPINNGKIVSLYRQIMDPTNLVKTDGVRKIDLSDESIQSIIDYMNLPGNLPGKEFALSLTNFFIKVAKDTKVVLENNGYNSTKLDEKRYNKEDFEGDDFIAKVMDQLAETRSEGFIPYTPIQATESPDTAQGVEIKEDDLFDSGDLQKNFSVISNNMITRRPGGVIVPTDIRQTLNAYTAGMANMNAKLPILRETQSVFSKRNLTAMSNAFAPQFTENLKANYISFMTDRVTPVSSSKTTAAIKTWLMTSTAIPMFLNFKSALLQLSSLPNFLVSYDSSRYIDASKKVFGDWALFKRIFFEIIDLPTVRQRFGGRFSPDSRIISEEVGRYGKVAIKIPFTNISISAKELLSKGYIFSSIGDVISIAIGAAPIYYDISETNKKKYIADGMSVSEAEEKATQDAEERLFEIIQETQQSSEAMYLSEFQKQSITRIFSSFATATMQYYRKARRAAARMKNKEGDQLQNAYEILHYTAVNAAMFQFFSSMFVDWLSGPGEDELEEMSREERMDFVRYMEDVMATVAQGTGGMGVALQAIILAYKESEKSGKPEKIVESALRTVPAVRMKYDAAVNTIREWKRGDYVRSLTKGAELANIPADRIRSLGLQVSDALTENLDAQERIARLIGFRTESWMREKKEGEIWNGVQSTIDKSTPAERQRAISNTKSAYRDLFQLYGKRYAEATTEAEKARVDSIASKELLNVYNHRQGGPEFTKELQKLFNQSLEFNSLPKDMQKLKNMESNRKIGDIVEEVLSLEKKSEQKAIEYWSSLVNNGVISKNEIERIREEYNTRKGLQ